MSLYFKFNFKFQPVNLVLFSGNTNSLRTSAREDTSPFVGGSVKRFNFPSFNSLTSTFEIATADRGNRFMLFGAYKVIGFVL